MQMWPELMWIMNGPVVDCYKHGNNPACVTRGTILCRWLNKEE
jgi:hypothetical protein